LELSVGRLPLGDLRLDGAQGPLQAALHIEASLILRRAVLEEEGGANGFGLPVVDIRARQQTLPIGAGYQGVTPLPSGGG
jgi:hypothetical protein